MSKNIIFCADGTWNNPDQDENADQSPDPTNVYKLFLCLEGELSRDSLLAAGEQEKEAIGDVRQVAKYIHGVGDSNNCIRKLLGGAFGAGVIARVVRGYTFISRNYEQGADISIIGFSRGAYTARALAGLIMSQGLLVQEVTGDREKAYRLGAEAWYRYRRSSGSNERILAHLAEIAADLPAFLSSGNISDADFIPIERLAAVGVWDTVGAMGIPEYVGRGKRVDAFKFVDTKLDTRVEHGFHAVSLDEQRNDFQPTLWNTADSVVQMLFPGAHADVGGGYPVEHNESGLSDIALQWMIEQLIKAGVRFVPSWADTIKPDPAGCAHQPWAHLPWTLPGVSLGARSFPEGLAKNPAIAARKAAGAVVAEPGEPPAPYRPANIPD